MVKKKFWQNIKSVTLSNVFWGTLESGKKLDVQIKNLNYSNTGSLFHNNRFGKKKIILYMT